LAPSLGGQQKFRGPNFSMPFLGKMSILTPNISDDHFLLVIDRILSVSCLFACLYSKRKTSISEQKILHDTFF